MGNVQNFVNGKLVDGRGGASALIDPTTGEAYGEASNSDAADVDDAVAALTLCIDQDVSGALNVCAPQPVSNAQISEQLAGALGRPSWLTAPAFGLKVLFGEGAAPILTGQYAVPGVLESRGFQFEAPSLAEALSRSL